MTLPEDDEFIFGLFVEWTYHRRYDIPQLPKDRNKRYEKFMQPVQLYVLADKYDVRNLKICILSALFLLIRLHSSPTLATIAYAYEHTPRNSAIRKFLAGYFSTLDSEWYQDASSQHWLRSHPEICTDVVVRLAKREQTDEDAFEGEVPKEYMEEAQGSEE